jgi:hypothetical protein
MNRLPRTAGELHNRFLHRRIGPPATCLHYDPWVGNALFATVLAGLALGEWPAASAVTAALLAVIGVILAVRSNSPAAAVAHRSGISCLNIYKSAQLRSKFACTLSTAGPQGCGRNPWATGRLRNTNVIAFDKAVGRHAWLAEG